MLVHFPYVLVIFVLVVSCSLLLILIRGRVVECACAILGVDNRPHQQLEKQKDKLISLFDRYDSAEFGPRYFRRSL